LTNATTFVSRLRTARVVAQVACADEADAAKLARTLSSRGVSAVELSAWTPTVVAAIAEADPGLLIGARATSAEELHVLAVVGTTFVTLPSVDRALLDSARTLRLPALPDVAGHVEAIAAAREGATVVRLDVAGPADGLEALRRYARLFPRLAFVPSGAIGAERIPGYLNEPSVVAVATTCPPERLAR